MYKLRDRLGDLRSRVEALQKELFAAATARQELAGSVGVLHAQNMLHLLREQIGNTLYVYSNSRTVGC